MSKIIKTDADYSRWIHELKERYRSSQIKAASLVNREMLRFYWSLGRDIVARDAENVYGSGFYRNLSQDLKDAIPEADCFSRQNLQYMKKMYLLYSQASGNCQQGVGNSEDEICQQAVGSFESEICPQVKLPEEIDYRREAENLRSAEALSSSRYHRLYYNSTFAYTVTIMQRRKKGIQWWQNSIFLQYRKSNVFFIKFARGFENIHDERKYKTAFKR